METYCGNNSLEAGLVNGTKVLGTRYGCFRKGIGRGFHLPIDNNYMGEYEPIDNRRIYCGNQVQLPNGYNYMGNLPQCLVKGIGVGKRLQANNGMSPSYQLPETTSNLLFVIMSILIFVLLVAFKPSLISKIDVDKKKQIVWWKFIALYITCLIILKVFSLI